MNLNPNVTEQIPFLAWEQAVFVALFIVFCGGVFFALRWIINAISKLTKDFQGYLAERDIQNQRFLSLILEKQEKEERYREDQFGNRNNALADALNHNTIALASLQQYIVTALTEMRIRKVGDKEK